MLALTYKFFQITRKLKRYDAGASMVEYALLVVLIALIAFVAVQFAGDELSSTYSDISDSVQNANNAGS